VNVGKRRVLLPGNYLISEPATSNLAAQPTHGHPAGWKADANSIN
jgi:hypothetical protein